MFSRDNCGCMGYRIIPKNEYPENVLYYPHKKQYFEPAIYCDKHNYRMMKNIPEKNRIKKGNTMYIFECNCFILLNYDQVDAEVLFTSLCKKHSNDLTGSPFIE